MTNKIIPFPKDNKRLPISEFKKAFIFHQEHNIDTTALSTTGAQLILQQFVELLENLGYDTSKIDNISDFCFALEAIKSYVLSYSNMKYPIQTLADNIMTVENGLVYLNTKNINIIDQLSKNDT